MVTNRSWICTLSSVFPFLLWGLLIQSSVLGGTAVTHVTHFCLTLQIYFGPGRTLACVPHYPVCFWWFLLGCDIPVPKPPCLCFPTTFSFEADKSMILSSHAVSVHLEKDTSFDLLTSKRLLCLICTAQRVSSFDLGTSSYILYSRLAKGLHCHNEISRWYLMATHTLVFFALSEGVCSLEVYDVLFPQLLPAHIFPLVWFLGLGFVLWTLFCSVTLVTFFTFGSVDVDVLLLGFVVVVVIGLDVFPITFSLQFSILMLVYSVSLLPSCFFFSNSSRKCLVAVFNFSISNFSSVHFPFSP